MGSDIRVLQVDDDDAFRELSVECLEREGFDVVAAADTEAGIDRLDRGIDCVVSDYDMPNRDGLTFLESVRKHRSDLPFILFTGKGSEEIASEAIGAGVTDYLQKRPGTEQFTLLTNRIERAVAERRAEDALAESERRLSTLVSNLPGVVYRCRNSPGWPMEYLGGNVEELTGYGQREFLEGDIKWGDLLEDAENEQLWADVQDALEGGDPFEATYRIADAEGNRRWVRERGRAVDGDGSASTIEGFITEITDQKRNERTIAEYDQLIDAVGDPIYTTDSTGVLTTLNEPTEERLGYDRSKLVGEHVSKFLDSEDVQRGLKAIRRLLEDDDRTSETYDITVRTADGERIELENHVALLTAEGEFYGTVGVLRETTDRPIERLRGLHEATRELMTQTNGEAIAEAATRAARDVLDMPLSSVRFVAGDELEVVASAAENASPDDIDRSPRPIEGTAPGRAFRERKRSVTTEGGDLGSATQKAYVPLGDHGVFSIGTRDAFEETDIQLATVLAANVQAALDRAEKQSELQAERDDFAALFENIPDPTIEVHMREEGPIVQRVNPAFEETFGYSAEEVRGENLDEYVLPEDLATDAQKYNRRIRDGNSLHVDVRRMTRDGLRDFIIHTVPHDVGEETTRGYTIYTDITEQKRRERALERQNERLDEFASVVSHDLRNPLSVARGHLELAESTDGNTPSEHVEVIDRAHERMDELINRLLAFAREGETATDRREISLESAAREAWETVETDRLSLTVEGSRRVRADPDRLRRLFENLFRNAVEHGHGASGVAVGTLEGGFYVDDDGIGIPESKRTAIRRSGHSDGDGAGFGFGLAIVEAIAEAHDWELLITESEAGGARFEFHRSGRA